MPPPLYTHTTPQYIFFNRKDCCDTRPTVNGYRMRLFNGAAVTETVTVGSTVTVNVKNFATAFNPPAYPDLTSAVQIANRPNWVRYVRLTATTANYLAWREIFVFDSTNTNVVKAKRCYSNVGCYSATNCCDKTVDHIIDTEATDPMCVPPLRPPPSPEAL